MALLLIDDATEPVFAQHSNQIMEAMRGSMVISGHAISPSGTTNLLTTANDVDMAVGTSINVNAGDDYRETATDSLSLDVAYALTDGTNTDVFVLISLSNATPPVMTVTNGVAAPSGQAAPPAIPANHVVLAQVKLVNGTTTVSAGDIKDFRMETPDNIYVNERILIPNNKDISALSSSGSPLLPQSLIKLDGSDDVLIASGSGIGNTRLFANNAEHTRLLTTGELILYGTSKHIGISGDTDLIKLLTDDIQLMGQVHLGGTTKTIGTSTDKDLITIATDLVTISGNLAMGGTGLVDGVDVALLKTDVDGFPDDLKGLTALEITNVLQTIGDVTTVSASQWGYIGNAAAQLTATTASPTFAGLTLTGTIVNAASRVFQMNDAAADTVFTITNTDGTFEANLDVEGDITLGGLINGVDVAAAEHTKYALLDDLIANEITSIQNINSNIILAGEWNNLAASGGATISAAQWTILGGLTGSLTFAELNFVDGVTSSIQTQIDAKQESAVVWTYNPSALLIGINGSGIATPNTADRGYVTCRVGTAEADSVFFGIPVIINKTITQVRVRLRNDDGAIRTYTPVLKEFFDVGSSTGTTTGTPLAIANGANAEILQSTNITISTTFHKLVLYILSDAFSTDFTVTSITVEYD